MKLLKVPDVQLESVIEKELEKNELLEREPPSSEEEFSYTPSTAYSGASREEVQFPPIEYKPTLFDFLDQQLGTLEWESEFDLVIADHIIGSIGPSGYLGRSLEAIQDDILLKEYEEVPLSRLKSILEKVQQLDPPGIAARNLQECLLIQLEQLLKRDLDRRPDEEKEDLQMAYRVIRDAFDPYSRRHFQKVENKLNITTDALRRADEKIRHLNPKPASSYTVTNQQEPSYVVPDFLITNREGKLDVSLYNQKTPRLRVNDFYSEVLQSLKDDGRVPQKKKDEYAYIKQKVDSAKWFIEAIRQRQQTLLKTMRAIVDYQQEYFRSGDIRDLRPMIYKDIAEITGLDISTISRVVNSKFVQTEFGTKRLKDFFSESISTESGEEVSNLEVKEKLRELIDQEDKRRPLSDQKLAERLQELGYHIARRTVAKYREESLGIPKATLRKEL